MAIEDCSKEENVPGYAHKHITFHFRNNPVIKGSEIADEMKKKKKAEKAGPGITKDDTSVSQRLLLILDKHREFNL